MTHQLISASPKKIIDVAHGELRYHEGRDPNGNWNNHQKYSPAVTGLAWSQGQPWCATFISWCAMTAGSAIARLYPRTASTDTAARWFKERHQWSEYPAIGAQGFLGVNGDMFHTFLVADFDDTYVYTIEGNTNDNGSPQGDGVYALRRVRRLTEIQGYGVPRFPEGVVSADPALARQTPPKEPAVPKPTLPISTPWTRTRVRLLDAINHPDAKAIPKTRLRIRALLATIRATISTLPKTK